MMLHRLHHQRILQVLQKFNVSYLAEHSTLFGGGTRIALEIEEYRESVNMVFFVSPKAYRAVREHIGERNIGALLSEGETISVARDIRSDRDAVRTFIEAPDAKPICVKIVLLSGEPVVPTSISRFNNLKSFIFTSHLWSGFNFFNSWMSCAGLTAPAFAGMTMIFVSCKALKRLKGKNKHYHAN